MTLVTPPSSPPKVDAAARRAREKELYQSLRKLSARKLWDVEVVAFDGVLDAHEREQRVSVVRAVGVKFANSRDAGMRREVGEWLVGLLADPSEKVRRYAAAALPKIITTEVEGDAGTGEPPLEQEAERRLIELWHASGPREREHIGAALAKIGGASTLEAVESLAASDADAAHTIDLQRVRASIARENTPSSIRLDALVPLPAAPSTLRMHLRCRAGLEEYLADEITEHVEARGLPLKLIDVRSCNVVVEATGDQPVALTLAALYEMRCFDTLGFVLAAPIDAEAAGCWEAVADAIASTRCEALMSTLTEGAPRYRLLVRTDGASRDGGGSGSSRLVADVARMAHARNPRVLNDAKQSAWLIEVGPSDVADTMGGSLDVELRPRPSPNPRLAYQTATFYAGAHPPLAACMARMAGAQPGEVVWDPCCGSAMELIESAIFATGHAPPSVRSSGAKADAPMELIGTDIDESAIALAEANVAAARACGAVPAESSSTFAACDFREGPERCAALRKRRVSLIISNPPLGQRVKVANLHALYSDLFRIASDVLRPGGRLVFINPLRKECADDASLTLEARTTVDLGLRRGASVEVWRKG